MAKFVKGQSGNPGGRPKVLTAIKELAQQHGESAFQRIIGLMASDDERVALAASQEVLNRAYGKAAQPIANDGDQPFKVDAIVRRIIDSAG